MLVLRTVSQPHHENPAARYLNELRARGITRSAGTNLYQSPSGGDRRSLPLEKVLSAVGSDPRSFETVQRATGVSESELILAVNLLAEQGLVLVDSDLAICITPGGEAIRP